MRVLFSLRTHHQASAVGQFLRRRLPAVRHAKRDVVALVAVRLEIGGVGMQAAARRRQTRQRQPVRGLHGGWWWKRCCCRVAMEPERGRLRGKRASSVRCRRRCARIEEQFQALPRRPLRRQHDAQDRASSGSRRVRRSVGWGGPPLRDLKFGRRCVDGSDDAPCRHCRLLCGVFFRRAAVSALFHSF